MHTQLTSPDTLCTVKQYLQNTLLTATYSQRAQPLQMFTSWSSAQLSCLRGIGCHTTILLQHQWLAGVEALAIQSSLTGVTKQNGLTALPAHWILQQHPGRMSLSTSSTPESIICLRRLTTTGIGGLSSGRIAQHAEIRSFQDWGQCPGSGGRNPSATLRAWSLTTPGPSDMERYRRVSLARSTSYIIIAKLNTSAWKGTRIACLKQITRKSGRFMFSSKKRYHSHALPLEVTSRLV